VKYFDWDVVKNQRLKFERGVSFEDIVLNIFNDKLITIIKHPNQEKYAKQKIFVIELHDYAYLVPFIETKDRIFLKTIFPSRKFTKKYIEKEDYEK
jgi:uncharacterized DUF497 family protein